MKFAAWLPNEEFLTALYERVIQRTECISGSENQTSRARRLRYVAELLELAPQEEPSRALDYGSGLGITLRILAACDVDAVGFDPSTMRGDYTRERQLTIVSRESELDGPFHILVLDNVLEHLPEPVVTLSVLRELTIPGTVAYVSVPPYEEHFMQKQVARHVRGEAVDMTLNPWEHLNYFSLVHLDALMAHGGFRRLASSERASSPAIGLRSERNRTGRAKNAAASLIRLAKYAVKGDVIPSAEHAFYRRES
jgi:hypothetical protein